MFSKHYDDGNRDIRSSQNGNDSFKKCFARNKNEKSFTTETVKPSMLTCLRKN